MGDSKKLYNPSRGLIHLERAVLAFARWAGVRCETLGALLEGVAYDELSWKRGLPWYEPQEDPALPGVLGAGELTVAAAILRRAAGEASVELAGWSSAVVYEDRFNRLLEQTRSKGRCAWSFVAGHLAAIWRDHGHEQPWVAVDQQGGRRSYRAMLQLLFEGARLRVEEESDSVSRYHIAENGRAMTVSFETGCEDRHLPTALASMTAKYLRELLMGRFNAFWLRHAPDLKPTAGYVQDGRRFLTAIAPVMQRLGIERGLLVRSR